ncbi:MAG: PQQ-dependent sugar dehydrogenase [Boseongicola sp.]
MRILQSILKIAILTIVGAAIFVAGAFWSQTRVHGDLRGSSFLENRTRFETIFIALDAERIGVPVEREGSGGALTSVGDSVVVMTHEGRFFLVDNSSTTELSVESPDNGFDAMLAFEKSNPDYQFAHFYFRYNDFAYDDGRLIVSMTKWHANDNCYSTVLATTPAPLTNNPMNWKVTRDDWEETFSTSPCLPPKRGGRAIDGHMAGGRIAISGDGSVFLASGDYAVDGTYAAEALAQNSESQYGKVLRINTITGNAEVVSQGHSNMQGISFDLSNQLYVIEHGRRGGDELNLIQNGQDYGWPQVSLGTRYNKLPLRNTLEYGRHPVFEAPIFAWLPSVAVSSLTVIEDFHPSWNGDLLAGSLSGKSLFRIRIRDGRVLFSEKIDIGNRIRHLIQHNDEIVLWTDSKEVIRLRVGAVDASFEFAQAKLNTLGLSSSNRAAAQTALEACAECHSFGASPGGNAPALGGIFGTDVASESGYEYSDGLTSLEGKWTSETLAAFLDNPDSYAPGTLMPDPGIDNSEILAALTQVLKSLALQAE